MATSLILRTAAILLVALMLLFSLFLLLRGHNEPGGGFLGGLMAAAALVLLGIAEGPGVVRATLRMAPLRLALAGLALAIAAGLMAALAGAPFLTGLWVFIGATEESKGLALGTPLLFDIGVYLLVLGAVAAILLNLEEDTAAEEDDTA